jgi:hypothetical protein
LGIAPTIFFKLRQRDETLPEREFLRATDFDARAFFDGLHVGARVVEAAAATRRRLRG